VAAYGKLFMAADVAFLLPRRREVETEHPCPPWTGPMILISSGWPEGLMLKLGVERQPSARRCHPLDLLTNRAAGHAEPCGRLPPDTAGPPPRPARYSADLARVVVRPNTL
jgi:hypothetical protein